MKELNISEVVSDEAFWQPRFFVTLEDYDGFMNKVVRRVDIPRALARYIWELQRENGALLTELEKIRSTGKH